MTRRVADVNDHCARQNTDRSVNEFPQRHITQLVFAFDFVITRVVSLSFNLSSSLEKKRLAPGGAVNTRCRTYREQPSLRGNHRQFSILGSWCEWS